MQITEQLQRVIEAIEPGFFGSLEIGIQNGIAGHAKVTRTYKLTDTSRESRNGNQHTLNNK